MREIIIECKVVIEVKRFLRSLLKGPTIVEYYYVILWLKRIAFY